MRVKSISLSNYRSFESSGVVELGKINVLIGLNNSGKSSVIRGLSQLQHGLADIFADVRVGSSTASIDIELEGAPSYSGWDGLPKEKPLEFRVAINTVDRRNGSVSYSVHCDGQLYMSGDCRFPALEPDNFIVPYFSKRKVAGYHEDVRENHVLQVGPDASFLAAKLSRLANPAYPANSDYMNACREVLGFPVTAIPSGAGQRPGVYLSATNTLAIDQMGEGVSNIAHFLSSLVVSSGKLFLIEELENDLHPAALKALLGLIVESSSRNQFVISTHSNIVATYLGGLADCRVLRVSAPRGVLPTTASVEVVPSTPHARASVLQELGYSFSDFGLWDAWLLLEESSAERIIRDYLIPWFAPGLRRVRTFSANGVGNIDLAFSDLHRLVLFTHLEPIYLNRTWVLVDGDEAGVSAVSGLQRKFPSIPQTRISCLAEENFELYYPAVFREQAEAALRHTDKSHRRKAKHELLLAVVAWLDKDADAGKAALAKSASDVICKLQTIESDLRECSLSAADQKPL